MKKNIVKKYHSPLTSHLSPLTSRKGFTLIEGVLSILIIGIGLIGVLYIFSGSTSSSLIADQTATATNLAEEKLETIIADKAALGYVTVVNTRGNAYYTDGALSSPFDIYSRSTTFQYITPPSIPDGDSIDDFGNISGIDTNYTVVTVTVSWNNGNNSVVTKTLVTNWTP